MTCTLIEYVIILGVCVCVGGGGWLQLCVKLGHIGVSHIKERVMKGGD